MTTEPADPPLHEVALPDLRSGLRSALPGLAVLVLAIALLGWVAREPLQALSSGFVERAGLPGVFVSELVLDAIPGVGAQPVIFLAYAGGLGFWPILLVSGLGGVGAGAVGWGIGRLLSRSRRAMGWLFRSGFAALLLRHRARAIFLGAILPFPYALTTIAAGAVGIPLGETLLGSLGRFPKALLNLALIASGWSLGSGG